MTNKCRICGSSSVSRGFVFQPYTDFKTTVYDCYSCGCRFTNRDEYIYEKLHSQPSTYSAHRNLLSKAKTFFEKADIKGLERYLRATPKNRFIIDSIKNVPSARKILEYGCSKGYLSSYSILLGKEFYGVDISETALQDATASFGKYFYSPSYIEEFPEAYFDLIYHVGTIGCVDEPIGFIRKQLKLLKPGGILLFNAPNVDVCSILDLDWLKGTCPPDLVTLFPPKFWSNNFSDLAEVEVDVKKDSPLVSYIRRKQSQKRELAKRALFENDVKKTKVSSLRRFASAGVRTLGKFLPPIGALAPLPQEFGVFVKMTRKQQ